MKAGKLRWPIQIQQKTTSTDSNTGEVIVTGWVTLFRPFADIQPIARGASRAVWETVISQQLKAQKVAQFDIRYMPGILETHRILDWYGNIWDIKAIVNVDQRNRELWLICEYGLTQG